MKSFMPLQLIQNTMPHAMAHSMQSAPACVGHIGEAAAATGEFATPNAVLSTRRFETQMPPLNYLFILGVRSIRSAAPPRDA